MDSVKNQTAAAANPKDEKPFNLSWLDTSYFETLFPGTPWQNINDMLSLDLSQAVRQQFNNPHRKQMIIELLGTQFKRSYLADEVDNPHILFPPNMTEEQRKKLENEAKSWLQIQINEIAFKRKCAIKNEKNDDELCNEMKEYLEHTYGIISTSLDRHLYLSLNQLEKNMSSIEKKTLKIASASSKQDEASPKNSLREALNLHSAFKKIENNSKTSTNLSTEYSELVADSLLGILMKDPRRIAFVINKLNGQQLTNNLRQFIWSDILLRHERKKLDGNIQVDIDLIVRKNFANGVTRGKNELKLSDPSVTPVANLIENAVIETYSRVFSLNELLEEQHLRQTIKILNVVYTYSRDYEPYFIYWLLPFQLTFNEKRSKSEIIYDLAMYLDLFVKNLFPPWNEIFTMAGKIMQDLAINDPEFYEHLRSISKNSPKVNPKDFVNEIIYNETKKANSNLGSNINMAADQTLMKSNKELLTEPTIFLRKWIGEGFAGVLHKNALLYVWDQLFMSLWAPYDFELITKAILYLLKSEFMKARDHDQMRRVFLEQPCRLYTADIQSAFMHLTSGRKENEVPALNRKINEPVRHPTGYFMRANETSANARKRSMLDPIGMKDIRLTLILPKLSITSDFDPSRVIVEATLYYGNLKLNQKQTHSLPLVKDIRSSTKETKTYELVILNDKLLFDVSEFDQEPYGLKEIFAFITVKYQTISYNDMYLGYCKLTVYTPQKLGNISTWDITQGEITRLLHPGVITSELDQIPDTPLASTKDRLGPGSSITLVVFMQDKI